MDHMEHMDHDSMSHHDHAAMASNQAVETHDSMTHMMQVFKTMPDYHNIRKAKPFSCKSDVL